ncbi:hypothetical protein S83_013575, partial [Arachis hypogaea]
LLSDFGSLPFLSFVEDSDFRGNHHHHQSPMTSTLHPYLTCIHNTLDAAMCLQVCFCFFTFYFLIIIVSCCCCYYMFLLKTCGVLVLVGAPSEIKLSPGSLIG